MPKVMQRKTSQVKPSFNYYDGDDPNPGVFRAVIKKCVGQMSSGGNVMIVTSLELQAKPGSQKSQYDGFFTRVYTVFGEHEIMIEKEQGLYLAIAGKEDADVKFTGDPTRFKSGDKQETPVETVGGKKPVGAVVNVRIVHEDSQADDNGNTHRVPKGDRILPTRDGIDVSGTPVAGSTKAVAEEEPEEDDVEVAEDYTEEDLTSKSLAALRKILEEEFDFEAEATKAIKKKSELVQEILDQQEDSQDEDEDEDDAELDEEDEDDAEEDEDDREEEIREELGEMSRSELRAKLKQLDPKAKTNTKMTEADIIEMIVPLALEEPPF